MNVAMQAYKSSGQNMQPWITPINLKPSSRELRVVTSKKIIVGIQSSF